MKTDHTSFNRRRIAAACYLAITVFFTYASIFAFRKPFTVASFEGIGFWGVSYQTLLIISQVIGYLLSKFAGIRIIAELKRLQRWKASVLLLSVAWFSLLVFALIPPPFGMICLFANGFALGFMWGIVFSYVEGRKATDFIGAVLAVSFIFAGGFSRSVGKWLMTSYHVSENWMPFATGAVFVIPLLFFYLLLERAPAPDEEDVEERTIRLPMDGNLRKQFLQRFGPGVVLVVFTYLFLTIIRDIRDNYMANMWAELGYGSNASVFTQSETMISLIVLLVVGMLVMVRNNILAFRLIHLAILAGFAMAGISSLLFIAGSIAGSTWMQLTGLGLYLAYVPFNSVFFERLLASFRVAGNVGFLIYIADAYGYTGSIAVMLSKEFFSFQLAWVPFFSKAVIFFAVAGFSTTLASLYYFHRKHRAEA